MSDLIQVTDFDKLRSEIAFADAVDKLSKPREKHKVKPKEATQEFLGWLIRKFDDLDEYSDHRLRQFPKAEKFLIVKQMRKILLNIERILVEVALRHHKKTSI